MLPKIITLVRHGLSEGNVMVKLVRKGRESEVPKALREQRPDQWRLTQKGVIQAEAAGKWLEKNLKGPVGRCVVSNFVRARETASHLMPPETVWYESPYLRERSWGDVERLAPSERLAAEALVDADPFHGRFPGGESIADICISRADRTLDTLARECAEMNNVLLVLHGESMWAFWMRLTKMRPEEFERLHHSKHPFDHIHNCQILQFTRVNPVTGEEMGKIGWMRSVCPTDLTLSRNHWVPVIRHYPTGAELRAEVERQPRLLPDA